MGSTLSVVKPYLFLIFRGSLEEAENDIDLLEAKLEKVLPISNYHYHYFSDVFMILHQKIIH